MKTCVILEVIQGQCQEESYSFGERAICTMGRASDCDVRFPNSVANQMISRHQCLLDINPPLVQIRDLGSRNGTYVNGQPIGKRIDRQSRDDAALVELPMIELHEGDEIQVGNAVVRVCIGAVDEEADASTCRMSHFDGAKCSMNAAASYAMSGQS